MGRDVPAPTVDSPAWDRVRGEPWEIWVVAGAAEKQVTRRKRHDRDNRFRVEGVSIFRLYINADGCLGTGAASGGSFGIMAGSVNMNATSLSDG